MHTPPVLANEAQRLTSLRRLSLLDTAPEERFDRITRVATASFDTPIALMSLVDEHRQWFKSRQGLTVCETSREVSFCAHAICQEGVFIVPDTQYDTRFSDNPLVVGDPRIRFYAGCPIHASDGSVLGTLCIIDRQPRQFSAVEQQALQDLAHWVEYELHTLSDVTHEKEREQMYTQRVAHLSHELRTPLTAMSGYLELLGEEQSGSLSSIQQHFLAIIQEQMNHVLTLVTETLDFAKIEAGQVELHKTTVHLPTLLEHVMISLLPQIRAKQQVLTFDLPKSLPAVQADAGRLTQVFLNLLSNAHRYTPQGGSLSIQGRVEKQHLSIDVQDTGIGLSQKEQAQLFTPFFRAKHVQTREEQGTGLGLVITRTLVQMHNGTITVTSSPGQGSTFTVILPLHGTTKHEPGDANQTHT